MSGNKIPAETSLKGDLERAGVAPASGNGESCENISKRIVNKRTLMGIHSDLTNRFRRISEDSPYSFTISKTGQNGESSARKWPIRR